MFGPRTTGTFWGDSGFLNYFLQFAGGARGANRGASPKTIPVFFGEHVFGKLPTIGLLSGAIFRAFLMANRSASSPIAAYG